MRFSKFHVSITHFIAILFFGLSVSPASGEQPGWSVAPYCHIPEPVVVHAEGVDVSLTNGAIYPQKQGSRIKPFQVVVVYRDLTCNFPAAKVTVRAGNTIVNGKSHNWTTSIEEPSVAVTVAAKWGHHYPLHDSFRSVPNNELVIFPGEATKADLVIVFIGLGQTVEPEATHRLKFKFGVVTSTRL